MLCFQCRRIAASTVRRASTTAARTSLVNRLPLQGQARPFLLVRVLREIRPPYTLQYSTASNTAANAANSPDAALPEKPDYLNEAESAIWDKLVAEFSPTEIMVQDISGGCGSMYGIEISSEKFRGANMLKQQRMVNAVLGDEMKGWHGVQLRTRVP
ncbi:bola-like protein [Xylariaceae sp. AK1471]|nr:bola-like protein [Xylariaceae sp. AK1471]